MRDAHDGETFDYLVVGSGAAGSILANRLSADSRTTVCVLEAGGAATHPYLHVPAGFIRVMYNPRFVWLTETEACGSVDGRRFKVPQGRVVGGSSAINGMVYNRGLPSDFDDWAAHGCKGWSYADVLPAFRRLQRRIGGSSSEFEGTEGEMPVTTNLWSHPLCDAFIQGAEQLGLPRNPDYNGASQEGVGYYQRTIHRGWRRSAADVFLKPALRRPTLTLRTDAWVEAIVFDGRRATGVRYRHGKGSETRTVRARREVIVACGTINSARLLQVSGIGPAAVIRDLGLDVVRDLPVGENFRDHYSMRVSAYVRGVDTINEMSRGLRLAGQVLRWAVGRPSILDLTPAIVHWFVRSLGSLNEPDLQGMFTPASYGTGAFGHLDEQPGMTFGIWQSRPESAGFVRAISTSVFDSPAVQPNFLTAEPDLRVLVAGLRWGRRLLSSPALAPHFAGWRVPAFETMDDGELAAYARQNGAAVFHQTGTCRMGDPADPATVVDPALRVLGIANLRIVDASVMPKLPSANPYASTMMVAERGAELIRQSNP